MILTDDDLTNVGWQLLNGTKKEVLSTVKLKQLDTSSFELESEEYTSNIFLQQEGAFNNAPVYQNIRYKFCNYDSNKYTIQLLQR